MKKNEYHKPSKKPSTTMLKVSSFVNGTIDSSLSDILHPPRLSNDPYATQIHQILIDVGTCRNSKF